MVRETEGLLKLSVRDRKKGLSVLQRMMTTAPAADGVVAGGLEGKTEVQRMLMFGYKAEMEIFGEGIAGWMKGRLEEEMEMGAPNPLI